jgi:hypothetical protein
MPIKTGWWIIYIHKVYLPIVLSTGTPRRNSLSAPADITMRQRKNPQTNKNSQGISGK